MIKIDTVLLNCLKDACKEYGKTLYLDKSKQLQAYIEDMVTADYYTEHKLTISSLIMITKNARKYQSLIGIIESLPGKIDTYRFNLAVSEITRDIALSENYVIEALQYIIASSGGTYETAAVNKETVKQPSPPQKPIDNGYERTNLSNETHDRAYEPTKQERKKINPLVPILLACVFVLGGVLIFNALSDSGELIDYNNNYNNNDYNNGYNNDTAYYEEDPAIPANNDYIQTEPNNDAAIAEDVIPAPRIVTEPKTTVPVKPTVPPETTTTAKPTATFSPKNISLTDKNDYFTLTTVSSGADKIGYKDRYEQGIIDYDQYIGDLDSSNKADGLGVGAIQDMEGDIIFYQMGNFSNDDAASYYIQIQTPADYGFGYGRGFKLSFYNGGSSINEADLPRYITVVHDENNEYVSFTDSNAGKSAVVYYNSKKAIVTSDVQIEYTFGGGDSTIVFKSVTDSSSYAYYDAKGNLTKSSG